MSRSEYGDLRTSLFICLSSVMRPLMSYLIALGFLSTVSPQSFNPQPQLGDYASLGVSRPVYYEEGRSFYAPPFTSGAGIDTLETLPNPPQSDVYVPFNEEPLAPRDFPNTPDIIANYGPQSNQYIPNVNPDLVSNRPVYSNNPQNPFPFLSPQIRNYAPTFSSPPLLDDYNPLFRPLTLTASDYPNIIREEDDGKDLSETKTSSTNRTFVSFIPPQINPNLDIDYRPNVSPPTIINGRAFEANNPQYYPEQGFPEQPFNPDFRQFVNPSSVENIQPLVNLSSEVPPVPNYPNEFSNDPSQLFGNPISSPSPPPYPTVEGIPSADIPDITLSGSPRNLGSFSSVPVSSPGFGGFTNSGFQPPSNDLPPLPNPYEAPGREVPA